MKVHYSLIDNFRFDNMRLRQRQAIENHLYAIFFRFFLYTMILGMTLVCINANAGPVGNENDNVIKEIKLAMDAFYSMDFGLSDKIIDKAIEKYPDDSLLYLVKGGFYLERFRFEKDMDSEYNGDLNEKILILNKKVIELAEKQLKVDPHDMTAHYYLGAAHGNIGRFYFLSGKWLKGFWSGRKGFKLCEKVIENNPDYSDAYLGAGLFHYLAATVPKVVKVLSFLLGTSGGDRERGIRELKLVRDKSQVLNVEARRILLRIARWEKNWEALYSGSKWLAEKYPKNVYFQIFYIYGLAHDDQFQEAQSQLNKVNILIGDNPDQLPLSIRTKYFRYAGFLNFHLEEYSNAIKCYLDAITLSESLKSFKKIWAEDYYFLAASYAKLMKKDEAFLYLTKAIDYGREKETIINQPEWKPFMEDAEFVKITKSSK